MLSITLPLSFKYTQWTEFPHNPISAVLCFLRRLFGLDSSTHSNTYLHVLSATAPSWHCHSVTWLWAVLFPPGSSLAPRCCACALSRLCMDQAVNQSALMAKTLHWSAKKAANVLQLSLSMWEEQRGAQSGRKWISACSVNCWGLECQYWA